MAKETSNKNHGRTPGSIVQLGGRSVINHKTLAREMDEDKIDIDMLRTLPTGMEPPIFLTTDEERDIFYALVPVLHPLDLDKGIYNVALAQLTQALIHRNTLHEAILPVLEMIKSGIPLGKDSKALLDSYDKADAALHKQLSAFGLVPTSTGKASPVKKADTKKEQDPFQEYM